jgi:hypothetical protein
MFRWQCSSGTWRSGNGLTKDISGHGISVVSGSIPFPGAAIEAVIHVPVPWSETSRLRGSGTVLRLQPEAGQPWGFAASLEFEEAICDGYWEEAAGGSSCDDDVDTSKSYDANGCASSTGSSFRPILMMRERRLLD